MGPARARPAHRSTPPRPARLAGRRAPRPSCCPASTTSSTFDPPWVGYEPPPVDVARRRSRSSSGCGSAATTTRSSSPPSTRARCRWRCSPGWPASRASPATSEDYPGSLLDVRHRRVGDGAPDTGGPEGGHEVQAALALARAAGHELPRGDDRRLRLRPLGRPTGLAASLPRSVRRRPPGGVGLLPRHTRPASRATSWRPRSRPAGTWSSPGDPAARRPVATGRPLAPADSGSTCARGRTELRRARRSPRRRAVCRRRQHRAPRTSPPPSGTPVVSLFAPVVPVERWRPWGVPSGVLGDQHAGLPRHRARASARSPGHPCLSRRPPRDEVVDAVAALVGRSRRGGAA